MALYCIFSPDREPSNPLHHVLSTTGASKRVLSLCFFQTWAHLCLKLKIPTVVIHIGMPFELIDVDSETAALLVSSSASLNMSSSFIMKLTLDLIAPHMATWVDFQYFSIHR